MLKLLYYYNWFLLVICFVLLFNFCRVSSNLTGMKPLMSIIAGITFYYAFLQFCVISLQRREVQYKNYIFAALILFELFPVAYIIYHFI